MYTPVGKNVCYRFRKMENIKLQSKNEVYVVNYLSLSHKLTIISLTYKQAHAQAK